MRFYCTSSDPTGGPNSEDLVHGASQLTSLLFGSMWIDIGVGDKALLVLRGVFILSSTCFDRHDNLKLHPLVPSHLL